MFNVRYDLTRGQLRHRSTKRLAGALGTRRAGVRKADNCSLVPMGGTSGGQGASGFGPAGLGVDQRYSPVFDRAEVPNLGQQFLPADMQSQTKIFKQIITFDPIVGTALEYIRDMTFSDGVILGGVKDEKVLQNYNDAIEASGIVGYMPDLLQCFTGLGRFVFHMTMNESKGYWDNVIPHDLDFLSIQAAPMAGTDPLIDLMPNADQKKWALSKDPRIIAQRREYDPVLVKLMAGGKKIPLAPENTMFMARTLFPWDRMGMSLLSRVLLFIVYEAAIFNASVAGARRRAGPLWHITAWEDAADNELTDLLNMFMAAEEDPVGAKVVTKNGVTVTPVGGGSGDYWKLSEEWPFLSEGKMKAMGVSEALLDGSASWNNIETLRTVHIEKLQAMNSLFTRKIILDKMIRQLAVMNDYTERTAAELSHRIRIGGRSRTMEDPKLMLPTVEWSRPLTPTRDQAYLDILASVKTGFGLPINVRTAAQAGGIDIDKELDNLEADLEVRKRIYSYERTHAKMKQKMGIGADGTYVGGPGEVDEDSAGGGFDFGAEDMGGGDEEGVGGAGGAGGGGGGGMEPPAKSTAPTEPAGGDAAMPPVDTGPGTAPDAGPGGAGAGLRSRFVVPQTRPVQERLAMAPRDVIAQLNALPLWDENDTLLGLHLRRAAEILDRIGRSDPAKEERLKLATTLCPKLRQHGLSQIQTEVLQYLAMRLGYLPKMSISEETYDVIGQLALDKMNGHGLTREITQELIAISRIKGELPRQEPQLPVKGWPPRNQLDYVKAVFKAERSLGHRHVLTGRIDPNRDLMPMRSSHEK